MHDFNNPALVMSAEMVDDLERARIAAENRLRSLIDPDVYGLDSRHPDVARLEGIVDSLKKIEHAAVLNLQKALRTHPLHPWIAAQRGIGEKTAARLLAVIGDPTTRPEVTEDGQVIEVPRTLGELRSYCGHGDPGRTKFKGMSQEDVFALGNPVAKKRLYLIAESCLKAGGPLADVYRARREATKDRLHATECRRCGPSGKPALPGSPWSAAHQHADALRVLGKEILKGLYFEARRLKAETEQVAA